MTRTLAALFFLIVIILTAPETRAASALEGRAALGALHCTACHAASETQGAWLVPKSAPRLAEIGSRAAAEWLAQFLAAPQETMPGTTMPGVLRGNRVQAEALTHFLLAQSNARVLPVLPDKAAVARGENLFHSVGCVACHAPLNGAPVPADSVPLPQMARKWGHEGLRRFLLDPLASRPGGRMPAMALSDAEASDIAHYLLRETRVPAPAEVAYFRTRIRSLENLDTEAPSRTTPAQGIALEGPMRERGAALRLSAWLNIAQPGPYTFHLNATGAGRLSIDGAWLLGADSWEREMVVGKHTLRLEAGRHQIQIDFVQRGQKEPALLVEWEGPGIARAPIPAASLSSEREPAAEPPAFVLDPLKAAQGRALYGSLGCANCHESKAPAPGSPALAGLDPARGCLAQNVEAPLPDFHLSEPTRESLRAAISALKDPNLAAPKPQERLAHTLQAFRCTACHVRDGAGGVPRERDAFFTANVDDLGDEGRIPPGLDGVGDKLRPQWLAKLLSDGAPVRPYLNTRMPQFGAANVGSLADLFVELDRRAAAVAPVGDSPDAQKEAGRRLAGTDGLSCIGCHRFARQPAHAMQLIDLTTVPERLNEDWLRRFLRNPNAFHPGTRMPAFWPGGKSVIPAVLEGDTERQHAALWTYLREGAAARSPEGLSRQNMELSVGGDAVVYRGKLWEAGFRGVATGFPGGLNASFDTEEMRLALIWRGRFLNVSPHWSVQGMGKIRPLGTHEILFPHGSPFAVLAGADAPWPAQTSKELGMKFGGYQIDKAGRPAFLYAWGALNVEDFTAPFAPNGEAGLRRTLSFSGTPPAGLYLRVAAGQLSASGDRAWRLNGALTIILGPNSPQPLLRGAGPQQELLVPLSFNGADPSLEIIYVW